LSLLDKIFGKKERSTGEIKFNDLPAWLESKHKNISDDISRNTVSIYSDIEKAQKDIRESLSALEKATPEGRFHLKMVKVASSNRDNMAKQVRMLLENITLPKDNSIKTIMAFHDAAIQAFGVCLDNMMKSYQYTKLLYIDESKNVIADVNSLGRLLNELIEPINSKKQVLDALDKAQELAGKIRGMNLETDLVEKSIYEYQKKSDSLKKGIEEKQEAQNLLKMSGPWEQYARSKEDLAFREAQAGKKLSEINGIISPLNKALNRLKQLSDSGRYTLKSEDREMLNFCLSCPADVPPEFFIEFQKIVESGVLNLPKTDKLLSQIQLAASSFGGTRKEYFDILHDIEQKKEEISKMTVAKEEKGNSEILSDLREKLATTEKELESSKKQLESLKNNIGSNRNELQQYVSVIDGRAKVA
jgi:hypothetical protein